MARRAGEPGLEAAEMKVRFKEGPRKWREETVMLVQPAELQATIKYVLLSGGETGREMLKPFNMAQASPRFESNSSLSIELCGAYSVS